MATGKYKEWLEKDSLIKLEGWARDGLTDEQIAHNMGIGYSTLQTWKKKYQVIQDTLKRGKEVIDIQVESALLKRAMGYEYTEVTKELTDTGMTTTKKVTKQISPDTTAAIFWLKNRKPKEWRDKRETELTGGIKVTDPYKGLTTEELRKIAEGLPDE